MMATLSKHNTARRQNVQVADDVHMTGEKASVKNVEATVFARTSDKGPSAQSVLVVASVRTAGAEVIAGNAREEASVFTTDADPSAGTAEKGGLVAITTGANTIVRCVKVQVSVRTANANASVENA